jgi:hypothetical protein
MKTEDLKALCDSLAADEAKFNGGNNSAGSRIDVLAKQKAAKAK